MEPGQAPNPSTIQSADAMPAPHVLLLPYRPQGRHGLTASPYWGASERNTQQALYDLLAAIRAIAETPEFVEETRAFLLDCIEQTLTGQLPALAQEPSEFTLAALRLYQMQFEGQLDSQWPLRLLQAARRDITRPTCATWSDLLLYCRYAAEPLGRAALQTHGLSGQPEIERATDALTASLLLLRMVRRVGTDWKLHGRCYLPTDWFAEEGGSPEQLVESRSTPAVRQVMGRTLDRVALLLRTASHLPGLLPDRRLRAEAIRLLTIAGYQYNQLKRHDPLRKKLKTPRYIRLYAHLRGWWLAKR
jgi:phytoene/squalene synthetase